MYSYQNETLETIYRIEENYLKIDNMLIFTYWNLQKTGINRLSEG